MESCANLMLAEEETLPELHRGEVEQVLRGLECPYASCTYDIDDVLPHSTNVYPHGTDIGYSHGTDTGYSHGTHAECPHAIERECPNGNDTAYLNSMQIADVYNSDMNSKDTHYNDSISFCSSECEPTYFHPDTAVTYTNTHSTCKDSLYEQDVKIEWGSSEDEQVISPSSIKTKRRTRRCLTLWRYLLDLLCQEGNDNVICWQDREKGIFSIVHSKKLAAMWGVKKNHPDMTYEHLARAIRHYYRLEIMTRIQGKRLWYQFGENATGWRSIVRNNMHTT